VAVLECLAVVEEPLGIEEAATADRLIGAGWGGSARMLRVRGKLARGYPFEVPTFIELGAENPRAYFSLW
jgi:hypothetical protein